MVGRKNEKEEMGIKSIRNVRGKKKNYGARIWALL